MNGYKSDFLIANKLYERLRKELIPNYNITSYHYLVLEKKLEIIKAKYIYEI